MDLDMIQITVKCGATAIGRLSPPRCLERLTFTQSTSCLVTAKLEEETIMLAQ